MQLTWLSLADIVKAYCLIAAHCMIHIPASNHRTQHFNSFLYEQMTWLNVISKSIITHQRSREKRIIFRIISTQIQYFLLTFPFLPTACEMQIMQMLIPLMMLIPLIVWRWSFVEFQVGNKGITMWEVKHNLYCRNSSVGACYYRVLCDLLSNNIWKEIKKELPL